MELPGFQVGGSRIHFKSALDDQDASGRIHIGSTLDVNSLRIISVCTTKLVILMVILIST
jgi:hypothetical protein